MGTGQSTGQSAPARAMAPHNFYGSRGRRSRPTRKDEHGREEAQGASGYKG